MLRLATDADFNGLVYRVLLRELPDLDMIEFRMSASEPQKILTS
jgi:hypothetical protein